MEAANELSNDVDRMSIGSNNNFNDELVRFTGACLSGLVTIA